MPITRYPLCRLSAVVLLSILNGCGGSGDSSGDLVSFGGAACETRATFFAAGASYDTLYNFADQRKDL